MRKPHLVCYDIADDKARRRAFGMLKARGRALQKSVFLVRLSGREISRLEAKLHRLSGPGDAILVVRIHESVSLPRPDVIIL